MFAMNLLKRILPFALTLTIALGLNGLLLYSQKDIPRHSETELACHTNQETKRQVRFTKVQNSGLTYISTVTSEGRIGDGYDPSGLIRDEELLLLSAASTGLGSASLRVISYGEPKSINGMLATQSAKITYLPQPSYWHKEKFEWEYSCPVKILRVTLSSTGAVTDIEPSSLLKCTDERMTGIVEAARKIQFDPAMRDEQPVSQRISILYKNN